MKRTNTLALGAGVLALAAVAVSQDSIEDWVPTAVAPAEHQLAPAFDLSTIDMQAWMETTVTGDEHAMLDQLVGEWDVEQKMWMPGVPQPMVSTMRSTTEWVLGKKHIKESLTGDLMGQPYEGMGITSYDVYNNRYNIFWADSMGTATYYATGFPSPDGGAIEAYGTMDEPSMHMRGKTVKYVIRAVDEDTHVFELHDLHIGGDNTMVMELTYRRRK